MNIRRNLIIFVLFVSILIGMYFLLNRSVNRKDAAALSPVSENLQEKKNAALREHVSGLEKKAEATGLTQKPVIKAPMTPEQVASFRLDRIGWYRKHFNSYLKQHFQFSEDEVEKLYGTLVEWQIYANGDLLDRVREGRDQAAREQIYLEGLRERDSKIDAVIGKERRIQWEELNAFYQPYSEINQLGDYLEERGEPLTQEQRSAMILALKEGYDPEMNPNGTREERSMKMAKLDQRAKAAGLTVGEMWSQWSQSYRQASREKARAILSASQFAGFISLEKFAFAK